MKVDMESLFDNQNKYLAIKRWKAGRVERMNLNSWHAE
jgi:hypothetical protein